MTSLIVIVHVIQVRVLTFDLLQQQMRSMQQRCLHAGVRMTPDLGQRTARIRLQGQARDVYKVRNDVTDFLHKMRKEMMEQQEAVLLAQFVSTRGFCRALFPERVTWFKTNLVYSVANCHLCAKTVIWRQSPRWQLTCPKNIFTTVTVT